MAELKYFQGTLTLSDALEDMNRMNYGVIDLVDGTFHSITNELERIYNSNNNLVRIKVRKFNDNRELNKMGPLHIGEDTDGVKGWFINSLPLDKELDEYNRDGAIDIGIYIEDFIYEKVNATATMEDTVYAS